MKKWSHVLHVPQCFNYVAEVLLGAAETGGAQDVYGIAGRQAGGSLALLFVGKTYLVLKGGGRCCRFENPKFIFVVKKIRCSVWKIEPADALVIQLAVLKFIE